MDFKMDEMPARGVYNLLIGLVAPRPIAWVTSMDEDGRLNAAPYSSYNYLCTDPPIVGMGVMDKPGSPGRPKDTGWNIKRTGEYVINVVTEDLLEKMNVCATDFPAGVNELEMAGLTTAPSSVVKVPRIAEAHAALECREYASLAIGNKSRIVLGQVVAMYVEDRFVEKPEGGHGPYIKAEDLHAVGRMNGLGSYVRTRDAFVTVPRISLEEWEKGKR
jgi:flavin reductase (DIM6/NTAB) family NADH-FMN oxidoreductase RutF